jgi:3-oxoacyl-ACP reductase-like protein
MALVGVVAAMTPFSPAFAQESEKDKPTPEASPAPATAPAAAAAAAPAPAPAAAPTPAAGPAAPMVDSIKILFDDKAKNDGELVLTFTPEGGAAKTIHVTIAKKMDRKDVARDATKELAVALGSGYSVDNYDSDKIKVEGTKGAKFSLAISSLTANGLSVRLK